MKKTYTRFDDEDLKQFEPEAKVGLIATETLKACPTSPSSRRCRQRPPPSSSGASSQKA